MTLMNDGQPPDKFAAKLRGIADRIRMAREHAGLEQQEFADRIGFSKRQVGAWENGVNTPPIWALEAIREHCDVDPEWILAGPGDIPLRDVGPELRDREKRIRRETEKMVRDAGMILPEESILDVMSLLRVAPPDAEREAKVHIRKLLMRVSRKPGEKE